MSAEIEAAQLQPTIVIGGIERQRVTGELTGSLAMTVELLGVSSIFLDAMLSVVQSAVAR
jgi:hypothetical protein